MSFVHVFWGGGEFITLFTAEGILKELSLKKVFTCIILGGWGGFHPLTAST